MAHLGEQYHFSQAPSAERPFKFVSPPAQPIEMYSTLFTSPIYTKLSLHGAHQPDKMSPSLTVISSLANTTPTQTTLHHFPHWITAETVRAGIEGASWPGRHTFHTLPRPVTVGSTLDLPVVSGSGGRSSLCGISSLLHLWAHGSAQARAEIAYTVDSL